MERLINKVMIYSNNNIKSNNIKKELISKLKKNKYELVEENYDVAISIGGDGSFLRILKHTKFNENALYIGVNTGTLGFAQEVDANNLDGFIDKLNNNEYKIEELGIEELKVYHENGVEELKAINEITIRESELNVMRVNIRIDDHHLENFVGDGLLISTSFGSTAYNLSFGGAIIHNDFQTLQITPIAPFNTKVFRNLNNSVVIPQNKVISIIPKEDKINLLITIDGENIFYEGVTKIEASVKDKRIKCFREKNYNFIDKVNEKFLK